MAGMTKEWTPMPGPSSLDDPDGVDLTVTEVAERLRVHPRTIVRWLDDGLFPGAYRLPGAKGAWRVPRTAVADFIRTQRQTRGEMK